MKQNSFFSQLYYSGHNPTEIIKQIHSGDITESEIKKSSVKDFVQYLSSMTENVSHKEQEKIKELIDIYIQDNKNINTIKKIKGNSVSFLAYLLIHVPLTINNLQHLMNNYDLRLNDNNEMYFLPAYIIKHTNFSIKHKLDLLMFFNDLNIDLSKSTIQSKNALLTFYFNNILEKDEDSRLKSFISFDLEKFNGEDDALLFRIINDLPFLHLKDKFHFIENEIKHTVKIFDEVMYGAFDNIKSLCIQDKEVFQKVSLFRTDNTVNKEEACLDFCTSYLFDFIYESLANHPIGNVNLLDDFINTISSFSDNFHLDMVSGLHSYINKPLRMQVIFNSSHLNDEERDKTKQEKLEKLLPLINYLKITEEKINIKMSLKESELTQATQHRKRI